MTKLVSLYEVRYFPYASGTSRNLSRKGRILPYRRALAVIRRLKRAGVDAVIGSPWRVRVGA